MNGGELVGDTPVPHSRHGMRQEQFLWSVFAFSCWPNRKAARLRIDCELGEKKKKVRGERGSFDGGLRWGTE